MKELKACPFCNRRITENELVIDNFDNENTYYYIECPRCLARGPRSLDRDIILNDWGGNMICPLMSSFNCKNSTTSVLECQGKKCAWWVEPTHRKPNCAIALMGWSVIFNDLPDVPISELLDCTETDDVGLE